MATTTSECSRHFGHEDFDPARLNSQYPSVCPVRDCSTTPVLIPYGRVTRRFCPTHGLRLHSNTFVYWNGPEHKDEARLRNFRVCRELAAKIALGSSEKAESHRLGYELSEDALTWNVFVGLAEAGRLRDAARFLTGRDSEAEPSLYLWGELIDTRTGRRDIFEPLKKVRGHLEGDIRRFWTEPDVMLVLEGRLLICIEAKFSSGNPLAHEAKVEDGEKPVDRPGLLRHYLDRAGDLTKGIVERNRIGEKFHSQLFRNIIFASEMANGGDWHVVNLASRTQWKDRSDGKYHSYIDPEPDVRSYLDRDYQQRFSFRTWEDLYTATIKDDPACDLLSAYMRSKSAHYRPAFDLA